MSTIIGLKELRTHTTEIAERVARGESFTVVKRTKPIFKLVDANEGAQQTPEMVDKWADQYIAKHHQLLKNLADR